MKALLLSTTMVLGLHCAHAATVVPTTYVHNMAIDNQPGAETGNLLTDGETGTTNWNGGHYIGFGDTGENAWASTTFTFDAVYNFETIDLYQFNSFNAGMVEISTSTDNVTFSSPTQYVLSRTPVGGSSTADMDSLDVTGLADAQYIQIDWFKNAANPGDGNWVFMSEVQFSAIPEPSGAALIGMGACALLLHRRKRR